MIRTWQLVALFSLCLTSAVAQPPGATPGREGDALPSAQWQLHETRPPSSGDLLPDPRVDPWSGGLLQASRAPQAGSAYRQFWRWPKMLQPEHQLRHTLSASTTPTRRLLSAVAAGALFQWQSRALESGLAYCAAGVAAAGLGQRSLATVLLQRAGPMLVAERSWYPAAVCTLRLAENHFVQAQLAQAEEAFVRAADLAERSQLARARALTRNGLGLLAHRSGHIDQAAAHYQAAGAIWEQIGDAVEAFKIAHNLGGICYVELDAACAESRFRHALALSQGVVELRLRANTQLALARLLAQTGRLREALDYYLSAADSFVEHTPDTAHEAEGLGRAWRGLAQTYQALGELPRARALAGRALDLFLRVAHLAEANATRVTLASIEREQGSTDAATALLAEVINSDSPAPAVLAAALIESASISATRASSTAAPLLQRARQLAQPGSRLDYAWWRAQALLAVQQQDHSAALAALSSAEQIAQQNADLVEEIDTRLARIDLLIDLGQSQRASEHIAGCQTLIAALRTQIIGEDLQRAWSLLGRRLSELQMDLAALSAPSTSTHLPLLRDLDRQATAALVNTSEDHPDPAAGELKRALRLLRERLAVAPAQQQQRLLEEIHVLITRLSAFDRKGAPADADASRFGAQFPSSLPEGIAALRYYVTKRAVHRWILQGDTYSYVRIARSAELDGLVERFRRALSDPHSQGSAAIASELGRALLVDFNASAASRVVIIADKQLWSIPFAALKTAQGRNLIEDAPLEYAPSLASMALAAAAAPIASISIFADPQTDLPGFDQPLGALPHARVEAAQLARLLPFAATPLHGPEVTASRFLASLAASTDVVHYSGHGSFDFVRPERGGLWLAAEDGQESGYLHFSRLREVRSDTRLVVLNGCGTGVSPLHDAAGALGFAREFHAAGVPAVVSTLWATSDSAAAAVSLRFYGALIDTVDLPSALRLAQLELLGSGRYQHPFYWAGYRLDRVRRPGGESE